MSTWDDHVAAVKAAYWTAGIPTSNQMYRAIADYAHSIFVRQTESDIPLAKSFSDSYDQLKIRLAGATITDTDANVIAAVQALLPVDTDTSGTEALLQNAILQARDDFNGLAARFEIEVVNAAMDLQRHIPYYQGRNETVYQQAGAGFVNKGFVSQVPLPADFRIQQVWCGRYFTALVEDVAFVAGDEVESNGRVYKVTVGGELTTGQLGTGLQGQERCVDESLGDMTFRYHCDLAMVPVRRCEWGNREVLYSGRFSGNAYTISPQFDSLWLYPAIVDPCTFFMLEWVGIKTAYADDDEVTFDIVAQQASAQYVRAMLTKDANDDGRASSAALQLYQMLVRKAVVDNQARETGSTSTTSELLAMNLGRLPWWRFAAMSCTSTTTQNSTPTNSEYEQDNTSGDVQITAQSPNHLAKINVSGAAGARAIALSFNKQSTQGGTFLASKGDRIVVSLAMALTVGIVLNFTEGIPIGAPILDYAGNPAVVETDGVNPGATLEFYFDGAKWVYLRSTFPA